MCLEKFRVIAVLFWIRKEQWAQLWLAPEKTGEEWTDSNVYLNGINFRED